MRLAKYFNHDFSKGSFFAYDSKGNEIYYEHWRGFWCKKKYNSNNNVIHYEDSKGYWYKREYDINGEEIYRETSKGIIIDNRLDKELLELEAKYKELGKKIAKLKNKK